MTIPKSVLLIIHSSMTSLMKLTSLLLVKTLSHSDYIMVYDYVANASCTSNVVPANFQQRQTIERCIDTKQYETNNISLSAACQKFNRYSYSIDVDM